MNARTARRLARREMLRTLRERRRALKATAGGAPQSARTHLLAAGLPATDAKRYSGAFSRGATVTAEGETEVKTRGGRRMRVSVKLYDPTAFRARLASYRPHDTAAAARFAAVAAAC